ncbi:MAG: ROK family protein [Thermoanaerobaculia bacterium]
MTTHDATLGAELGGPELRGASSEAIIGVDLGGTRVRAGRVRDGKIECSVSHRISGAEAVDVVLGEIFEAIDEVADGSCAGIGCGVPSVVDVAHGIVYAVENIPSWQEVPFQDELERRYLVPARINNDANAFAVGELYFGQGRGHRNLVGITIGTGLGSGVVIDGHLYSGTNCGAGEIGNIPYRDGTLESFCSGAFLRRESGMDGEAVFARARDGDPAALELFRSLGGAVGDAVMIALYAYDPEIVILGGSVSRGYAFFEKEMRQRLRGYAFAHALGRLHIVRSEIEDVALLGAAAIYLDSHLTKTI